MPTRCASPVLTYAKCATACTLPRPQGECRIGPSSPPPRRGVRTWAPVNASGAHELQVAYEGINSGVLVLHLTRFRAFARHFCPSREPYAWYTCVLDSVRTTSQLAHDRPGDLEPPRGDAPTRLPAAAVWLSRGGRNASRRRFTRRHGATQLVKRVGAAVRTSTSARRSAMSSAWRGHDQPRAQGKTRAHGHAHADGRLWCEHAGAL
jgi:hypothetical protein